MIFLSFFFGFFYVCGKGELKYGSNLSSSSKALYAFFPQGLCLWKCKTHIQVCLLFLIAYCCAHFPYTMYLVDTWYVHDMKHWHIHILIPLWIILKFHWCWYPPGMHNSYILRNTSTRLVYKFQILDDTSTRLICLKSNTNPTLVFTLETRYPHNIGIYTYHIPTKIRLGLYIYIFCGMFLPFSRNYFGKKKFL
jgi:hypothetical protein